MCEVVPLLNPIELWKIVYIILYTYQSNGNEINLSLTIDDECAIDFC